MTFFFTFSFCYWVNCNVLLIKIKEKKMTLINNINPFKNVLRNFKVIIKLNIFNSNEMLISHFFQVLLKYFYSLKLSIKLIFDIRRLRFKCIMMDCHNTKCCLKNSHWHSPIWAPPPQGKNPNHLLSFKLRERCCLEKQHSRREPDNSWSYGDKCQKFRYLTL